MLTFFEEREHVNLKNLFKLCTILISPKEFDSYKKRSSKEFDTREMNTQ